VAFHVPQGGLDRRSEALTSEDALRHPGAQGLRGCFVGGVHGHAAGRPGESAGAGVDAGAAGEVDQPCPAVAEPSVGEMGELAVIGETPDQGLLGDADPWQVAGRHTATDQGRCPVNPRPATSSA
jgi:hypothetical protein